jgi:hypothetical protein
MHTFLRKRSEHLHIPALLVQGISMGVASVISDYAPSLPPLLVAQQGGGGGGEGASQQTSKFLQLGGNPWRGEAEGAERLQVLDVGHAGDV